MTPIAWARLLARAGVEFWATKQWQQAFFAVGVRGQACDLSSDILQRVPLAAHGVAGVPQPPSRAESMAIWPRNRRMAYAYDLLFSRMTVGSPAKKQHYQASGPRCCCVTWFAAQVLRPRLFSLPESLLRVKPFLHNPLASLRAVLLQPCRWPCLLTLKRPDMT